MIDISGINKAKLLAALYDNARPQGMGHFKFTEGNMPESEAEELLKRQDYFDYVNSRIMKVDISGAELDPWGYDRDNGQGAAQCVVDGFTT